MGTPVPASTDRLEGVVRMMQRSFANLNDRITAMEASSSRSGKSRTPERLTPMREGAGGSEPDSSFDGGHRRPQPRRKADRPAEGPGSRNHIAATDPEYGRGPQSKRRTFTEHDANNWVANDSPTHQRRGHQTGNGGTLRDAARREPRPQGRNEEETVNRRPRDRAEPSHARPRGMKLDKYDGSTSV